MTMGARKTVPPRMFRMVPLGESHTKAQVLDAGCDTRGMKLKRTLLELEFLDPSLVWGDGCTLDTDRVFQNGIGRVHSDLVVRLISIRQTEVVVLQVDIEVRMYELVLDVLPYYPRHLIAIELDYGVFDLNLLSP